MRQKYPRCALGNKLPPLGHSMIELLLTLMLFGLLLFISPLRSAVVASVRLRKASDSVLSALNTYSTIAQHRVTNLKMLFDINSGVYSVVTDSNDILENSTSSNTKLATYYLPPSVRFLELRTGATNRFDNSLSLRHDGTASPGTIVLALGEHRCSIIQSLRGARRLQCSS